MDKAAITTLVCQVLAPDWFPRLRLSTTLPPLVFLVGVLSHIVDTGANLRTGWDGALQGLNRRRKLRERSNWRQWESNLIESNDDVLTMSGDDPPALRQGKFAIMLAKMSGEVLYDPLMDAAQINMKKGVVDDRVRINQATRRRFYHVRADATIVSS